MCVYEWDAVLCAVSFMKSFGGDHSEEKIFFFSFNYFYFLCAVELFFSVSLFFLLAALFVVVCINIQIIQL